MKIRVTNIPLVGFAEGTVDVPDGTSDVEMQEAVRNALGEQGYQPIGHPDSFELNEGLVRNGWEFSLEKIGSGDDPGRAKASRSAPGNIWECAACHAKAAVTR